MPTAKLSKGKPKDPNDPRYTPTLPCCHAAHLNGTYMRHEGPLTKDGLYDMRYTINQFRCKLCGTLMLPPDLQAQGKAKAKAEAPTLTAWHNPYSIGGGAAGGADSALSIAVPAPSVLVADVATSSQPEQPFTLFNQLTEQMLSLIHISEPTRPY